MRIFCFEISYAENKYKCQNVYIVIEWSSDTTFNLNELL